MRILLDDQETGLQAKTVREALEAAAAEAGRTGRMIIEVAVDGMTWAEEDIVSAEHSGREAGEIRCATAHPAELLRDTLAHAAEAVLNAEEIQRSSAKLMQGDRAREGFNKLLEALAVWGSVQTAVTRGLELGVLTREEIRSRGIDLDGALAGLDAQLRTLRDAMVAQDTTSVADCLLYEFPRTSKSFATVLVALAEEADRKAR